MEPTEILRTIRVVAGGQAAVAPCLTAAILREFQRNWAAPQNQAAEVGGDTFARLTEREIAILRSLAAGYSNKEISVQLGFAEKTIRNSLTRLFQKLHLRDRTQAVSFAIRQGLVLL